MRIGAVFLSVSLLITAVFSSVPSLRADVIDETNPYYPITLFSGSGVYQKDFPATSPTEIVDVTSKSTRLLGLDYVLEFENSGVTVTNESAKLEAGDGAVTSYTIYHYAGYTPSSFTSFNDTNSGGILAANSYSSAGIYAYAGTVAASVTNSGSIAATSSSNTAVFASGVFISGGIGGAGADSSYRGGRVFISNSGSATGTINNTGTSNSFSNSLNVGASGLYAFVPVAVNAAPSGGVEVDNLGATSVALGTDKRSGMYSSAVGIYASSGQILNVRNEGLAQGTASIGGTGVGIYAYDAVGPYYPSLYGASPYLASSMQIINDGTAQGTSNGIFVKSYVNNLMINNGGNVIARGNSTAQGITLSGGVFPGGLAALVNSGTIQAAGRGIDASGFAASLQITLEGGSITSGVGQDALIFGTGQQNVLSILGSTAVEDTSGTSALMDGNIAGHSLLQFNQAMFTTDDLDTLSQMSAAGYTPGQDYSITDASGYTYTWTNFAGASAAPVPEPVTRLLLALSCGFLAACGRKPCLRNWRLAPNSPRKQNCGAG